MGVWTKSFSGVAIEAVLRDYTFSLDLSLSPTYAVMKRIMPEDPLKYLEEPEPEGLNAHVDLTRKLDVAAVEKAAKQMAALAKKLMRPRKKPSTEHYEYGGKTPKTSSSRNSSPPSSTTQSPGILAVAWHATSYTTTGATLVFPPTSPLTRKSCLSSRVSRSASSCLSTRAVPKPCGNGKGTCDRRV